MAEESNDTILDPSIGDSSIEVNSPKTPTNFQNLRLTIDEVEGEVSYDPVEFDDKFFNEMWIDFQLQSGYLESKIENFYRAHIRTLYIEHILRVVALKECIEDADELESYIHHSNDLFSYYREQMAEIAQVEQTYATPTHTSADVYSKLYRPPADTLIEKGKTPRSRLSQMFTPHHQEKYTIAFDADDVSKTDDEILKLIEVKDLDTGQVVTLFDASSQEKETSPRSPVISPPEFSNPSSNSSDNNAKKDSKINVKNEKKPVPPTAETKEILTNGATRLTENARNVPWLADQETNNCMNCKSKFSLFKRRHHCRNCGRIFCNACSKHRAKLAGFKLVQRVCQDCHLLFCEQLLEDDLPEP